VIYAVVLFFVPFIFIGGIESIRDYFLVLWNLASGAEDRWGTVQGFVAIVIDGKVSPTNKILISRGCEIVFLVVALLCGWFTNSKWKRAFFLYMILVSFVPSSHVYNLVYLLAPALMLMREDNTLDHRNIISVLATVVLAIVFSMPAWMILVFREGIQEGIFKVLFLFFALLAVETIWRKVIIRRFAQA
jgi:hypothetical protein